MRKICEPLAQLARARAHAYAHAHACVTRVLLASIMHNSDVVQPRQCA